MKTQKKTRANDKKKASKFLVWEGAWQSFVPFQIDEIVDGMEGLRIRISSRDDASRTGVFSFDVYYGYRNFREGDIWLHLEEIGVTYSGVYVADASDLMDWAAKQSLHGEVPSGVRHYIFASIQDVFEVLAFDEPSFEVLS